MFRFWNLRSRTQSCSAKRHGSALSAKGLAKAAGADDAWIDARSGDPIPGPAHWKLEGAVTRYKRKGLQAPQRLLTR